MKNMELTVAEGIEKYLEESNVRPVTMEMLKGCAKNKSFEFINNIKIKNLDQETIRAWVDTLIERGFSEHTIANYFGLLRRAVKFSCNLVINCKLPKRERNSVHADVLTENLFTQILLCCDDITMKSVLLSYYANANNHEVCNLTYKDVFYDNNAICLYSTVKLENGTWKYYENGPQDQNIRFALIPKNVMEFIGRGKPDQKVIGYDYKYLSHKYGQALIQNKINFPFRNLKTAALYKKIYVNPIGIVENQHLFAFSENKDLNVIDCITDYINKGGRDSERNYNIKLAYREIIDKSLGELSKEVLERWAKDLCEIYEQYGINRYFNLLNDVLLDASNGKYHLSKWHLNFKSTKIKTIKVDKKEVPFDKEAVRRLFDFAIPELKKALLLSGYGGFLLTEIVQIKVKDIDREKRLVSFGNRSAYLSKAMVRFLAQGDPDDNVVKANTFTLSNSLKKLCRNYGLEVDFVSLRGAYIDDIG